MIAVNIETVLSKCVRLPKYLSIYKLHHFSEESEQHQLMLTIQRLFAFAHQTEE